MNIRDRIYQPEGATNFSCEETDWVYLTQDHKMPAHLHHLPTSSVFQIDMDIPEGAETFYPVRSIYAVLAHHCGPHPTPTGDELLRIAREALTLWLTDEGYLRVTSHVQKQQAETAES